MAKRKLQLKKEFPAEKELNVSATTKDVGEDQYQVFNMQEKILPIPYFTGEGKVSYLHLRLQGRNGQVPPVISSYAITPEMKKLEKQGFIRLVKVN